MSLGFDIARDDHDFAQILALQRQNALDAVSSDRLASDGFVYARHSLPLLRAFAERLPQVVARDAQGRIVGYTLAMPPELRDALPELVPMFAQFDRASFRGRPLQDIPYMVGGQVCVARAYRGRGLMAQLYRECRRRLPPEYALCVTEVSARNPLSLRAHLRMGFESIGSYHDGREQWHVIAWDLGGASARGHDRDPTDAPLEPAPCDTMAPPTQGPPP